MNKSKKINSFSELYEKTVSSDSFISLFIPGHLVIEFLLVKIVEISQPKLLDFAEGLMHFKLIQLTYGLGHINEEQKDCLTLINKMRNKLAHDITFEPSVVDIGEILLAASKSFTDMTDGISQGLDEIKNKTSLKDCEEWVLPEMFVQISYDLHEIYQDLGGDIENF